MKTLGHLQMCQHLNHRDARRRRGRARNRKLFETIMKENFPNLVKEINIQVQEAQRIPNKMHAKRPTPIHITVKMPNVKDKERILKAVREKQVVTYKGVPIRQLISQKKLISLQA